MSLVRTFRLSPLALLELVVLAAVSVPVPLEAGACTVGTVVGVAFGNYDVFATAPSTSTGSISYSCTLPVMPPVIKLGAGSAGSFSPRAMRSGQWSLAYNLFLDASRTTIWGDGNAGTHFYQVGAPADGQTYTVTVFGGMPARQNVGVGAYSDSILVTIDF